MPTLLGHSPPSALKPPAGSQLDSSHPLAPLSCWPMNDMGGLGAFDYGLRRRATLVGGAVWSGSQGVILDGTSGYIDCGATQVSQIVATRLGWSMSWWQYWISLTGASNPNCWSIDNFSGGPYVEEYSSGRLSLWYGGVNTQTSGSIVAANRWYHLVLAIGGDGLAKFYLNGAPQIMSPAGTHVVNSAAAGKPLRFGVLPSIAGFTSGIYGGMAFYPWALNGDDARRLYAEPFSMFRGPDTWRAAFAYKAASAPPASTVKTLAALGVG